MVYIDFDVGEKKKDTERDVWFRMEAIVDGPTPVSLIIGRGNSPPRKIISKGRSHFTVTISNTLVLKDHPKRHQDK